MQGCAGRARHRMWTIEEARRLCSHADPTGVAQGLGHGRNPGARFEMTAA